jgi:superoxide dismutase
MMIRQIEICNKLDRSDDKYKKAMEELDKLDSELSSLASGELGKTGRTSPNPIFYYKKLNPLFTTAQSLNKTDLVEKIQRIYNAFEFWKQMESTPKSDHYGSG